ncbi:MAG: CoA transferase [Pseudorhodoplanes sp.]|nr:CoA transferase [Pseudorhodoplanes sp.]
MTGAPPLAGVRVVDASRVLAGPLAGQILADLGADVLKVEPPQGDETRFWGPPFLGDPHAHPPTSAYFTALNRSKRNRVLDLGGSDGRAVFAELLAEADVLLENFKAGTLEAWGFDRETIERDYPGLIHARISGFGRGGPLDGAPGYDAIVQAMTGLMSVNGSPESGPLRLGVPIVDLSTGHYAAIGILAALRARDRDGRGQLLEVSLYDVGLAVNHPHVGNSLAGGDPPSLQGNSHPNIAPYDLIGTATAPVYVTVGNDRQFASFAAVLGVPELATDARFRTNAARVVNRAALLAELAQCCADKDGAALAARLLHNGVPAAIVATVPQALEALQTRARGSVVDAQDYRGVASPIRLSTTPVRPPTAPEPFGGTRTEPEG